MSDLINYDSLADEIRRKGIVVRDWPKSAFPDSFSRYDHGCFALARGKCSTGTRHNRGNETYVFYDLDQVSRREVIEAYFDANPDNLVGTVGAITDLIRRSNGDEWAETWREINGQYRDELTVSGNGDSRMVRKTCPLCGEEGIYLSDHLLDCPESL